VCDYVANPSKLDQQICFEVYKAAGKFSKLYARALEPFDLTFTQYLVLLALWEEDSLLIKDIGIRLELGIGTLNPLITRMEDRGWIVKQQSETDRRATIISLTEKARVNEKPIERAIIEKIISCNFMDINTETLMTNLKNLNAFLGQLV